MLFASKVLKDALGIPSAFEPSLVSIELPAIFLSASSLSCGLIGSTVPGMSRIRISW